MANPLTFDAKVLKVDVAKKYIKHEASREAPAFIETMRIGKITLEFDADSVNVHDMTRMITDAPVVIGLANTQHQLPGEFQE